MWERRIRTEINPLRLSSRPLARIPARNRAGLLPILTHNVSPSLSGLHMTHMSYVDSVASAMVDIVAHKSRSYDCSVVNRVVVLILAITVMGALRV
jgi:hypothetical protein